MKQAFYKELLKQLAALIDGESDMVAIMANVSALIKEQAGHHWVGFYIVRDNPATNVRELCLGPFQGPVACYRIGYGKGVCGTAWARRETVVVPDVEAFPGHIACSSLSRSEIVVPVFKDDEVTAVLDIDSAEPGTFDSTDAQYLEQACMMISEAVKSY